jgi:hypothetical protein
MQNIGSKDIEEKFTRQYIRRWRIWERRVGRLHSLYFCWTICSHLSNDVALSYIKFLPLGIYGKLARRIYYWKYIWISRHKLPTVHLLLFWNTWGASDHLVSFLSSKETISPPWFKPPNTLLCWLPLRYHMVV